MPAPLLCLTMTLVGCSGKSPLPATWGECPRPSLPEIAAYEDLPESEATRWMGRMICHCWPDACHEVRRSQEGA